MTNQEKYEAAFQVALGLPRERLADLERQSTYEWDSVGHMQLITALEESFEIALDTDDIFDLDSYAKGRELLLKYGVKL